MKKLLIVEDDPAIVEGLEDTFRFHDFAVFTAGNSIESLKLIDRENPDLVILDIMLPGIDGFEICKKIREQNNTVPIIMLTAKAQESDKLLGFELGADDYVTKPFSVKELVARVKAIIKRQAAGIKKSEVTDIGEIRVNFTNYTLTKGGRTYPLSPKEQQILKLLTTNPDIVIDRDRIIDEVWGDEYYPSPRTIDNFILKLRNKIEPDPKNPSHLITVHGAGYRFRF